MTETVSQKMIETGSQKMIETGSQKMIETGSQKMIETGSQKMIETGSQKMIETGSQKMIETGSQKMIETGSQKWGNGKKSFTIESLIFSGDERTKQNGQQCTRWPPSIQPMTADQSPGTEFLIRSSVSEKELEQELYNSNADYRLRDRDSRGSFAPRIRKPYPTSPAAGTVVTRNRSCQNSNDIFNQVVMSRARSTSRPSFTSGQSGQFWVAPFLDAPSSKSDQLSQLYAAWLLSSHRYPGPSAPFSDSCSNGAFLYSYRKPKRLRTAFSPQQLMQLEDTFEKNSYLVGQERKDLAITLGLTETQVKVWFQNRRTKQKRFQCDDMPIGPMNSSASRSNNCDTDDTDDYVDVDIDDTSSSSERLPTSASDLVTSNSEPSTMTSQSSRKFNFHVYSNDDVIADDLGCSELRVC